MGARIRVSVGSGEAGTTGGVRWAPQRLPTPAPAHREPSPLRRTFARRPATEKLRQMESLVGPVGRIDDHYLGGIARTRSSRASGSSARNPTRMDAVVVTSAAVPVLLPNVAELHRDRFPWGLPFNASCMGARRDPARCCSPGDLSRARLFCPGPLPKRNVTRPPLNVARSGAPTRANFVRHHRPVRSTPERRSMARDTTTRTH
jgi:hypothetical protein